MTDYLIDYYSARGVLFASVKITAINDVMAELEALPLAMAASPASYKITRLEKSRNTVIRERVLPTIKKSE